MLSTTLRAVAYSAAVPAFRELAGARAAGRASQPGTEGQAGQLTAAGVQGPGAEQQAGQLTAAGVQGLGTEQRAGQLAGSRQPGTEPQPGQPSAAGAGQPGAEPQPGQPSAAGEQGKRPGEPKAPGETQNAKDREVIRKLAARDAEVRAHEAAHAAAGGQYAGSPSFGFQRGPDGKNYAVSGEVPIDISAVSGDPAATIAKMQQVKQAALAPASPSGADRSIAAAADATIAAARADLFAKGGKDASQTDATGETQSDASGGTAGSANAGRDQAAPSQQGAEQAPGDVARDLFGLFAQRSSGMNAYQSDSARAANSVLNHVS